MYACIQPRKLLTYGLNGAQIINIFVIFYSANPKYYLIKISV